MCWCISSINSPTQTNPPEVAKVLLEIQESFPQKLIVGVFMGGSSMIEPVQILQNSSIPCYEFPEQAIQAIKFMCNVCWQPKEN